MDIIRRFGIRLNIRYFIWGIVIWFFAMLIGYSVITLRIDHLKDKLRASGIEITHEFSNLISLPLLEKDSQTLNTLLTDAAKRKDVIYASVVDHRNKIVAFTGTGHLMPDMTEAASSVEKVSIWEGGFKSHAKILNFASDVTYASTKIGEIFIGLSTAETLKTKNQFIILAITSCLILLFLIMAFRYRTIREFLVKYLNFNRSTSAMESILERPLITCPLCGTQKLLTNKLFNPSPLDSFLTFTDSKHGSKAGNFVDSQRIYMHELAKKEDLSWIRRQIILRCTEIIKTLAA
jgi:hypothetical protein